jgi:hypothetical protein
LQCPGRQRQPQHLFILGAGALERKLLMFESDESDKDAGSTDQKIQDEPK